MTKALKILRPASPADWRTWLSQHHQQTATVWVAVSKKNADQPTLSQAEAVNEALCYGWIDGTAQSLNEHYFLQSFSRRKPKSVWSKINKEKIRQFKKAGRLAQPGLDSIAVAKANGYWNILDEVEALIVPEDLAKALRGKKAANEYFTNLARSRKKRLLQWIVLAQRPETRKKRITEIVAAAATRGMPNGFETVSLPRRA
ncbi:YdeI/OmpD-associated family protein [Paraflavitalea pollutisoli]|uniref:YdeI/OmpD-associated family protein n=1 Tax=Paraflavitalea pollutisoli TaxID=3034143 RepID=UPI0023EDDC10|nr:YdeI/OmpD-associated family protein [Paraflavitalea sp. H1-2-19X]